MPNPFSVEVELEDCDGCPPCPCRCANIFRSPATPPATLDAVLFLRAVGDPDAICTCETSDFSNTPATEDGTLVTFTYYEDEDDIPLPLPYGGIFSYSPGEFDESYIGSWVGCDGHTYYMILKCRGTVPDEGFQAILYRISPTQLLFFNWTALSIECDPFIATLPHGSLNYPSLFPTCSLSFEIEE